MTVDNKVAPFHVTRGDLSRSTWYSGFLLTFLVTGEETGGRYSLVEEVARQGHSADPPLHVHTREDESFYILEGELTFFVADEVIQSTAGTVVFLPRLVPHRFTIDSDEARILNLCTPAGFEGFFKELSEPAGALVLPPEPSGPPDVERLIATAARYGVTILPPEE